MNRPTRNQWAMELARVTAQRATCLRRQVGCVLLDKRGHVLATGYNGVAAGQPHCNDHKFVKNLVSVETTYPHACPGAASPSGTDLDSCQAIHAEQNALLQCRDVHKIHKVCVTTAPCVTCTKLLLNTSCQVIIFAEDYVHPAAKELWEGAGRSWFKLEA